MVAVVAYLEPQGIHLGDVLMITIPATILGLFLACIFVNKIGKELKDDPEYQRRLKDPKYADAFNSTTDTNEFEVSKTAKISFLILMWCFTRCVNGCSAFFTSSI